MQKWQQSDTTYLQTWSGFDAKLRNEMLNLFQRGKDYVP